MCPVNCGEEAISAPALATLVASVTSALASMPSSLVLSADDMDPAAEVVAAVMLMAGVVPPLETIGAVPVTEDTPPPDPAGRFCTWIFLVVDVLVSTITKRSSFAVVVSSVRSLIFVFAMLLQVGDKALRVRSPGFVFLHQ